MASILFDAYKKSKPLARSAAPGLWASVDHLSRKAGVEISEVRLLATPHCNAAYHPPSNGLWITQGMLDLLDSKNLHAKPSKELQSLIGHELGHLKLGHGKNKKHVMKMWSIAGGITLASVFALYILDKTGEKIRESKQDDEDHPKAFWRAFQETTNEMLRQNIGKTLSGFYKWSSPVEAKMHGEDPDYRSMPWSKAIVQEARVMAFTAAMLVPALAVGKPLGVRMEYDADKFSAALMGKGKHLASTFEKLMKNAKNEMELMAKTPMQKNWVRKIIDGYRDCLQEGIYPHPPMKKRIKALHSIDADAAARSFGISP